MESSGGGSPGLVVAADSREGRPHLLHLDGLRGCLSLYVVLHHVYMTASTSDTTAAATPACRWLAFGRVAVDGFIVLSGYCLTLPVLRDGGRVKQGPWGFYMGRCRRILPTFYLSVAFAAIAMAIALPGRYGTPWDSCGPITLRGLVNNLLMVQDLTLREGKINYVFWSVAVEWRIYLLFPLMVWLWRGAGVIPATFGVIAASMATAVATAGHDAVSTTASYFGLFALGTCAAHVASRRVAECRAGWGTWCLAVVSILAAAVVVIALTARGVALLGNPVLDLSVGLAFAAGLAYWSGNPRSTVRRMLAWQPLTVIGLFSYSLYLVHAVAIEACWRLMTRMTTSTDSPSLFALMLAAVPASLGLGYAFFLTCEQPFLSQRQRVAVRAEMPTMLKPPVP